MEALGLDCTPNTGFLLLPLQLLPPKLLLILWLLLTSPVMTLDIPEGLKGYQGSLSSSPLLPQLQCYCIRPKGDMNCTWEFSMNPDIPYNFYYQSLKYHPNRTQNVSVPRGQGWVTVEREHLTISDQYLVWLSPNNNTSQPGDPEPLSLYLDDIVKPEPPKLFHEIELSEDPPVVTVTWLAPDWPHHEKFKYQLRFRNTSTSAWQLVEPIDLTSSFLELQDLEPSTVYEVSSRCQLQNNMGFWSDWSSPLKFQSPPAAPTNLVDMWVFGSPCSSPHPQEEPYVLLWKDPMPGLQLKYKVVFQAPGEDLHCKVMPCCSANLTKGTEWVSIVAFNTAGQEHTSNLTLTCSGSAPKQVQVNSTENQGILVTWVPDPQEHQEFVVAWDQEKMSPWELNWTRLPIGSHRTLLRGNFKKGVPYRVTVTGVSLKGLAFSPPIWGYSQEIAPLGGPALRQLPNAASGALTLAWNELPRGGGHFTHYTLYVQQDSSSPTLFNVSADTQNVTLWDLPGGHYKIWMTASTIAGPGQPGQSLQLYLPERNSEGWKVLLIVFLLCGILLLGCCLGLVFSKRCLQLCHKLQPHWASERIPDPSNSKSIQSWGEELPQVPPPKDALFLEVEEVETPLSPVLQPPVAPIPLDSGYEKHFLPTPEELGLLTLPRPQTCT